MSCVGRSSALFVDGISASVAFCTLSINFNSCYATAKIVVCVEELSVSRPANRPFVVQLGSREKKPENFQQAVGLEKGLLDLCFVQRHILSLSALTLPLHVHN